MGDLKFRFGVDAVGMEKRQKVGLTEVKRGMAEEKVISKLKAQYIGEIHHKVRSKGDCLEARLVCRELKERRLHTTAICFCRDIKGGESYQAYYWNWISIGIICISYLTTQTPETPKLV